MYMSLSRYNIMRTSIEQQEWTKESALNYFIVRNDQ